MITFTDIIDIFHNNRVQTREITEFQRADGSVGRNPPHRPLTSNHPLAIALKKALPESGRVLPEGESITPDFVRIEVKTGFVRIDDYTHIVEGGKEVMEDVSRRFLFPGDDYCNDHDKVQKICKIVHTTEAINAYRDRLAKESPVAALTQEIMMDVAEGDLTI